MRGSTVHVRRWVVRRISRGCRGCIGFARMPHNSTRPHHFCTQRYKDVRVPINGRYPYPYEVPLRYTIVPTVGSMQPPCWNTYRGYGCHAMARFPGTHRDGRSRIHPPATLTLRRWMWLTRWRWVCRSVCRSVCSRCVWPCNVYPVIVHRVMRCNVPPLWQMPTQLSTHLTSIFFFFFIHLTYRFFFFRHLTYRFFFF